MSSVYQFAFKLLKNGPISHFILISRNQADFAFQYYRKSMRRQTVMATKQLHRADLALHKMGCVFDENQFRLWYTRTELLKALSLGSKCMA